MHEKWQILSGLLHYLCPKMAKRNQPGAPRKKRLTSIRTESSVDTATGEWTHRNNAVFHTQLDAEKFIMAFHSGLDALGGVGKMEVRVFLRILGRVQFDTGEFAAHARFKARLAQEVGLSERSIREAIENLLKAGLLLKYGTNDYGLNPLHFWVGSQSKRAEALADLTAMADLEANLNAIAENGNS